MMDESCGSVLVMAGNVREGRLALGSKCGMKRIDGRFPEPSAAAPASSVEAILGPAFCLTLSTGAAVSARFLVIGLVTEGVDWAVVVTAGAGSDEGGSVEVDC
jgi:hypothetical protein